MLDSYGSSWAHISGPASQEAKIIVRPKAYKPTGPTKEQLEAKQAFRNKMLKDQQANEARMQKEGLIEECVKLSSLVSTKEGRGTWINWASMSCPRHQKVRAIAQDCSNLKEKLEDAVKDGMFKKEEIECIEIYIQDLLRVSKAAKYAASFAGEIIAERKRLAKASVEKGDAAKEKAASTHKARGTAPKNNPFAGLQALMG